MESKKQKTRQLSLPIAAVLGVTIFAGGFLAFSPQIDIRGLADGQFSTFGFPKIIFPKIEFPKVEEPNTASQIDLGKVFGSPVSWKGVDGYPEPWKQPTSAEEYLRNINLFQSALSSIISQLAKAPVGSELFFENGSASFIYDGGKKSVDASKFLSGDALKYLHSALGKNAYSLTLRSAGIEANMITHVGMDTIITEPIAATTGDGKSLEQKGYGWVYPIPPLR